MAETVVRVLLIEDDEDDFVLAQDMLSSIEGTRFDVTWAQTYDEAIEALSGEHDVGLVDYRLGGGDGLAVLSEAVRRGCRFPLIMLTGQGDRDVDLEAMRSGAADFLAKDTLNPGSLERSIRYSIERKRSEETLRKLQTDLEDRVRERTAELTRLNAALRDADRRKDEFLAMLAHELRNPLAAVKSGVSLLEMDASEDRVTWAIPMIGRQVDQLAHLIDDLLDVSRITRGKIQLRRRPLDLSVIIDRAVAAVRPLVSERRHRLEIDVDSSPLPVSADPTRLEQILVNLLTNAAKYTDEGGRIALNVRRGEGLVTISVRDDGIGMSPETLSKIFDLFAQADRSLDRSRGGLGIGLTLVKLLVEMHEGQVSASSAGLGKGSEFTVTMPLLPASASLETTLAESESAVPPKRRLRILIADDNVDLARGLAMFLEKEEHDVKVVHDGDAALSLALSGRYDVVLLDIGLPGLDGYEIAKRVRASNLSATALFAVTGYGQERDRLAAEEAGFDGHLVKPVDYDALRSLLADVACSSARPLDEPTGESILVIEDQRALAHLTKHWLEKLGYQVTVAHDGPRGLETARRLRPSAVLCDINLASEMDGYDVARALRASDETAGTRLIALTGMEGDRHEELAVAAGFDATLIKPVDLARLKSVLAGGLSPIG